MTQETNVIKPYNDSESKKGQVSRMFDGIAPYYDFLNRFFSLGIDVWWRKKAIGLLKDQPSDIILDVATGTCDLAIEAVKQLKPKEVIGIDIAAQMLHIGQKKIDNKNLSDIIKIELGDSENLRFPDAYFDIAMSSFGVRNFENLEKGLSEMWRVIKPGGTIMVLEFSRPRVFPIKNLYNIYFKYFVPLVGKLRSKDPKAYQYLYESVQSFPDYEDFNKVLRSVGFKDTTFKIFTFGICTAYFAKK